MFVIGFVRRGRKCVFGVNLEEGREREERRIFLVIVFWGFAILFCIYYG